jgi:hypothetical protein
MINVELGFALERLADYLIDRGKSQQANRCSCSSENQGKKSNNRQVQALAAYRLSMAESLEGNLEASIGWLDQGEDMGKGIRLVSRFGLVYLATRSKSCKSRIC